VPGFAFGYRRAGGACLAALYRRPLARGFHPDGRHSLGYRSQDFLVGIFLNLHLCRDAPLGCRRSDAMAQASLILPAITLGLFQPHIDHAAGPLGNAGGSPLRPHQICACGAAGSEPHHLLHLCVCAAPWCRSSPVAGLQVGHHDRVFRWSPRPYSQWPGPRPYCSSRRSMTVDIPIMSAYLMLTGLMFVYHQTS